MIILLAAAVAVVRAAIVMDIDELAEALKFPREPAKKKEEKFPLSHSL